MPLNIITCKSLRNEYPCIAVIGKIHGFIPVCCSLNKDIFVHPALRYLFADRELSTYSQGLKLWILNIQNSLCAFWVANLVQPTASPKPGTAKFTGCEWPIDSYNSGHCFSEPTDYAMSELSVMAYNFRAVMIICQCELSIEEGTPYPFT